MTYYTATSELESFSYSGGVVMSTDSDYFDPLYTRGGIKVPGDNSCVKVLEDPVSEIWVHFNVRGSRSNNASSLFWILNSGGNVIASISTSILGNTTQFRYLRDDGDSITILDTGGVVFGSSVTTFDVHITAGGEGTSTVTYYMGGIMIAQWVGVSSYYTDIKTINFKSGFAGASDYSVYSEIIVSSTPTTGRRLIQRILTGNSLVNLDWIGDYTDVNELGVDDNTVISTNAADDVSTFTLEEVTGFTYEPSVEAILISFRGQTTGGGPQNIRGAVRTGGANFFSSNVPDFSSAQSALVASFPLNPDTGLKWTWSEANDTALEAGLKSIA